MARAFVHGGGFESGTLGEWLYSAGLTDSNVTTGPAPPMAVETYVLSLGEGSPNARYVGTSKVAATSGPFGFHFWVRWTNVSPSPDPVFFLATHDKTNAHASLQLRNGGVIRLRDANDALVADSSSGTVAANTWYAFRVLLTHGNPGSIIVEYKVKGGSWAELFNETGEDFDQGGANMSAFYYGQAGGGASGCNSYLASAVFFNGCSGGVNDFLDDWEAIGYQRWIDSATPDVGDDLTSGKWKDAVDIPFDDTTKARYTVQAKRGVVTTHSTAGGKIPGPYGDSRIDGDANIFGATWLFEWSSSLFSDSMRVLHGDIPYTTPTVDGTTVVVVGNSASPKNTLIVSELATDVPDTGEYGQAGIMTRIGMGAHDSTLYDWHMTVWHEPSPPAARKVSLGTGFIMRGTREVWVDG